MLHRDYRCWLLDMLLTLLAAVLFLLFRLLPASLRRVRARQLQSVTLPTHRVALITLDATTLAGKTAETGLDMATAGEWPSGVPARRGEVEDELRWTGLKRRRVGRAGGDIGRPGLGG